MKKYCNNNKERTRCASLDFIGDERRSVAYCLAYKKDLRWFKATKLILACDECQKRNKNKDKKES